MMVHRTIVCGLVIVCATLLVVGCAALPGDEWSATINYTAGTLVQNLTFGTNLAGTDQYDAGLDTLTPPSPPGARNEYYFSITDPLFDQLTKDIRYIVNATHRQRNWTLIVLSQDTDMCLSWNLSGVPQNLSYTMNVANHTYDMKQSISVSLPKSSGDYTATITAQYSPPVAPVTTFTANVTTGYAPLTVAFTDTSSGMPEFWNWSFGDGERSTVQHPVHVYSTPGNYSVSLLATNAKGTNLSTRMDYIAVWTPPPDYQWIANITYTAGTLVQNLTFGTSLGGTDQYDAGLDILTPPGTTWCKK
jgi:PKD repeat protein